jgi:hypothetical protein
VELAKPVQESQSYISKLQRREVRLDLIQMRTICKALGTNLGSFVSLLEERLEKKERKNWSRLRQRGKNNVFMVPPGKRSDG